MSLAGGIRRTAMFLGLMFSLVAGGAQAQEPWTTAERATVRAMLGDDTADLPDPKLEAAVVAYAEAELGQRLQPGAVDRLWAIAPPRRDAAAELGAARARHDLANWLAALSPPDPAYQALRAAAARYRALAAAGGWGQLAAGPPLQLGSDGPAVAALHTRLTLEGYGAAGFDPQRFDTRLVEQLSRFQADRGVAVTGRLDAATRTAMNTSVADRQATLEANLERWRWMPHVRPAPVSSSTSLPPRPS